MTRRILLLLLGSGLSATLAVPSPGQASPAASAKRSLTATAHKPRLRIVGVQPLVVKGTGFPPREHVQLLVATGKHSCAPRPTRPNPAAFERRSTPAPSTDAARQSS